MARRGIQVLSWRDFAQRAGATGEALVDLALSGEWCDSVERQRALGEDIDPRLVNRWVRGLDVVQWHDFELISLTACGKRLGSTRQRATQLRDAVMDAQPFDDTRTLRAPGAKERQRAQVLAHTFESAVRVIQTQPGITMSSLAARVGAPESDLRYVLGDLAGFTVDEAWFSQRGVSKWSDADIAALLTECAQKTPDGVLTRSTYEALTAHRSDAPSGALLIRRYGSWSAALSRFGLSCRQTGLSYAWARSRSEALEWMVRFVLETGKTSSRAYEAWAKATPNAIRVPQRKVGEDRSWTAAISAVFERFAHGDARPDFLALVNEMALARAETLRREHGVEFPVPIATPLPSIFAPLEGEEVS